MDMKLAGRTVLITGGSKGIGLACAQAFLGEGATVAITSRDPANIAAAKATLGGDVLGLAADLTDAEFAATAPALLKSVVGANKLVAAALAWGVKAVIATWNPVALAAVVFPVFGVAYLGIAHAMRIPEAQVVLARLGRRFGMGKPR